MSTPQPHAPVKSRPIVFDDEQIKSIYRSEFLTTDEAAWYCGFKWPDYADPAKAFRAWVDRQRVRKSGVGRRLRFFKPELRRVLDKRREDA